MHVSLEDAVYLSAALLRWYRHPAAVILTGWRGGAANIQSLSGLNLVSDVSRKLLWTSVSEGSGGHAWSSCLVQLLGQHVASQRWQLVIAAASTLVTRERCGEFI